MSQKEVTLQNLRDTLEHLTAHQRRLEWTEDRENVRVLTEAMIRDLERCMRLCESLQHRYGGVSLLT